MQVTFDTKSIESYQKFLAVKQLPAYSIRGRAAWFPDEYAERIGEDIDRSLSECDYQPLACSFDYQAAITRIAVQKRKFSAFVDCGFGKTIILLDYSKAALEQLRRRNRGVLIVCPLMVVRQTLAEAARFFPGMEIEQVRAKDLPAWLATCGGKIGITNYDAITEDCKQGKLGALILDESGMLKSHYGKWGTECIRLGRGIDWKLALTGVAAPNDRIEYANHAVFMDAFPTVNSFLATFFVNRGQTQERWEMKPHALRPFYRALSHWSIFLTNPATYGWKDNCGTIPPIHVTIHDVNLTSEQEKIKRQMSGEFFVNRMGGITGRSKMGQLAKGRHNGEDVETLKPNFCCELLEQWPDESTLVWCKYNPEQETLAEMIPGAVSISGSDPYEKRIELIDAFKSGEAKTLISKPKILGFGLNLQRATRQLFSTLQDSYEEYYQAVKRSNRVGSTRPLNVHIPVTELEEPMVANVLRKADRVQDDTEEQERLFKELAYSL